jgi:hypothetical protein
MLGGGDSTVKMEEKGSHGIGWESVQFASRNLAKHPSRDKEARGVWEEGHTVFLTFGTHILPSLLATPAR